MKNLNNLEERVSNLEKKSARKRKTIGDTVKDLEFLRSAHPDNLSASELTRIVKDRRISKELKAAIRSYVKTQAKYFELRDKRLDLSRLIKGLSRTEKETVALAYSDKMDLIVEKLTSAIKQTTLTYNGKKLSPGIHVEKTENGQNNGVFDNRKFRVKFIFKPYDFAHYIFAVYPNRHVRTKVLPNGFDQDDFFSKLSDAFGKSIERHLPGFTSIISSYDLVNANYHGNGVLDITVDGLIHYIEKKK
jgi:hypothetical protein